MEKVCVMTANRAYGVAGSRLPIVEHLLRSGYRVVIAGAPDASLEMIAGSGAEFARVESGLI